MQDTVKRKIELEKKQLSLKNMYFNRYLIVRYLTAFFLFHEHAMDDSASIS